MRRLTLICLLPLLVVSTGACQVNEEMVNRVAAGEVTEARASWWGFDAEDSTEALQAAINSGAEKLIVEDMGSPWIVRPIELASNQEIIFEEGVEILAKRGEFKAGGDNLFAARNVENVTLRGYGATFRMWRDDYDNPDLYTKAEWRHTLSLRGVTNASVLGLTFAESGGDGIYLGAGQGDATNLNVHIKDVVCERNYRQGISVITAENLLIEDTIMRDTAGISPQAGIDFEPNRPTQRLVNVVMRNCLTENNVSYGYVLSLRQMNATSEPVSVRFENCRSVNDAGGGFTYKAGPTLESAVRGLAEFIDFSVERSGGAGIAITKPAERGFLRFERCELLDCAAGRPAMSPITLDSPMGADTPRGGVQLTDVVVRDGLDRSPMTYHNRGGVGLERIDGNLILLDAAGNRTNVELTEDVLAAWMPITAFRDIPRLSLEGVRLAPLAADPAASAAVAPWPILRKFGDYVLYAAQGDEVSFTIEHMQVGSLAGDAMPVRVIAPSGAVAHEATAPFLQATAIRFVAPETGVYTMSLNAGRNSFQVRDPSHPLNVSGAAEPLNFLHQNKDLIFWVPEGTREFGVRVYGAGPAEAVAATLINSEGEVVGAVDNQFELHQFEVELDPPGRGEVWTLQIRKPSDMTWEDHCVDLRGIPPLLAPAGAPLLVPAGD
ncbi:MAG: hypothetical protein ACOX9R_18145 [Armatimonadota bacterium]|jgi:hypothetical protein